MGLVTIGALKFLTCSPKSDRLLSDFVAATFPACFRVFSSCSSGFCLASAARCSLFLTFPLSLSFDSPSISACRSAPAEAIIVSVDPPLMNGYVPGGTGTTHPVFSFWSCFFCRYSNSMRVEWVSTSSAVFFCSVSDASSCLPVMRRRQRCRDVRQYSNAPKWADRVDSTRCVQ